MVGEEEDVSGLQGQCQIPGGRRMFWRSASWSSSRTAQQGSGQFEGVNGSVDPEKNIGGQFRKFPPLPLTPRSQQNCKARACLPPLQPLSIARRSLDEWPKAGSDDLGEWPHPPTPSGRDSSKPREGLKLDLATCQKNPDPTASLVNRDRIAYFDKECSKVAGHIYLGGDAVAKNRDILRKNGITHVLNCVGFVCPEYFKADLVYKTLWLQDSPSEDITSILYDVFDYFEDVREQGGRVFVHCCQGVSRSTSLVIAYLMWREGQSFDDAFQYVKAARGIANPNMGFACQLLQCQKRVHAIPLSPSSLLRMYRMAPHSPYDPLHLVPKMLNDPSPCALDSRGAFIVHVPSAIYIWIGRRCEPIMEKDAKGAASQVVRYERVQGQIVTVKEGQEQSKFWDAFFNLPLLLDKSSNCAQISKEQAELASKTTPGDRKVDAYDADFELLEKAITGGVVPPFSTSDASNETHLPARESNWSVLRRRFATSNTKESVSAPRISLFRAYSDSVLIVDCDINKVPSLPADCSTSSSPYFSPDSVSSDLSTCSKSSSDSPSLSPPTSSRSRMPSPALSTLSQLSLPSSKKSIFPVCDNVDTQSVTGNLKASFPSKSFSLSLAQRRGSLSPSLKLPVLNKDTSILSRVVKNESSISLATKQDNLSRSSSSELHANQELIDFKVRTENVKEDISLEGHSVEALIKESSSFGNRTRREDLRGFHVQEDRDLSELAQSLDKGLNLRNGMSPLVCSWPGFKRVAGFGVSYMNSNSVYLLLVPSANLGKHENRVLYLWIGKSFKHDRSWTELNNNKGILEVKDLDWNQIACNFLALMSLPEDIPIKVIKEEEEPAEFFDLLKCL